MRITVAPHKVCEDLFRFILPTQDQWDLIENICVSYETDLQAAVLYCNERRISAIAKDQIDCRIGHSKTLLFLRHPIRLYESTDPWIVVMSSHSPRPHLWVECANLTLRDRLWYWAQWAWYYVRPRFDLKISPFHNDETGTI